MATEAQLTRLGDVGPREVAAALRRHGGAAAPKLLPAVQLAVLGARAAGAAAGRPLASLPAAGRQGKMRWREAAPGVGEPGSVGAQAACRCLSAPKRCHVVCRAQ